MYYKGYTKENMIRIKERKIFRTKNCFTLLFILYYVFKYLNNKGSRILMINSNYKKYSIKLTYI